MIIELMIGSLHNGKEKETCHPPLHQIQTLEQVKIMTKWRLIQSLRDLVTNEK